MTLRRHQPGGRAYDVVVIGSGVGGSMAAHALVESGLDVLMIERGPWVRRGLANWSSDAVLGLSPYYTMESHYLVNGDDSRRMGTFQCVGGPSVFYGAVSYRMREVDFEDCPEIVGGSDARWPYRYDDLEPYYGWAERILGVAGRDDRDPTAPRRSERYPRRAPDLRGPARLIWDAASSLGLTPSYLPLAIDFGSLGHDEGRCRMCGTCDGYACAVGAKQDPSASVLPRLLGRGLTLVSDMVAVRLLRRGDRVLGVECVSRKSRRRRLFRADRYVLAAGAIGSPQLVLASGLDAPSPAGDWVGRCLMRHCNGIVLGVFREPLRGSREFHKQVGVLDFYGGTGGRPKLGSIQSIHPPPPGLLHDALPACLGGFVEGIVDRSTGLLVIAEDEPRPENRVELSRAHTDRFGTPRALVTHRHTWRDARARHDLAKVARAVLRQAGARLTPSMRIRTFSHAVGTLRMGSDPRTSPLDGSSRLRGTANLWVVDGSFMPRSAGVNPSLTIAANALMAAQSVAETGRRPHASALRSARSSRVPLPVLQESRP